MLTFEKGTLTGFYVREDWDFINFARKINNNRNPSLLLNKQVSVGSFFFAFMLN